MLIKDKFEFAGMPKIEIPKRPEEITIDLIKQYLPSILAEHSKRVKKAEYLFGYLEGDQDIKNKIRKFEKDGNFNFKGVENHAQYQINIKKGFLAPMEFAYRGGNDNDDLQIFKNYLNDVNFNSVVNDLKEDIYTTGIGITFIQPKPNILDVNNDNKDFESPFYFEKVSILNNFVVYSSLIGLTNVRLFAVNISEENEFDNVGTKIIKKVYTVYTPTYQIRFKDDYTIYPFLLLGGNYDIKPNGTLYKNIPLVEHSINQRRQGLVETVKDIYDVINLIVSNSVDNINDNANNVIVFKNTDVDEEDIQAMKDAGAIVIKSLPSANGDATVFTLYVQFDHDKINTFYEQRLKRSYDLVGVPLPSQLVSSGGDTTGARELGGGWTSAFYIIAQEILGLMKGDREVLKQMFEIAKLVPESKINNVNPNQIEIKYVINKSDNLLTKTQSAVNLKNANVPIKHIVSAIGLWGDEYTVSKEWQDAIDKIKVAEEKKKNEDTTNTKLVENGKIQN